MNTDRSRWFKSSYSAQNGACVEAQYRSDGRMAFRDSKTFAGPEVTFPGNGWLTFLAAVKTGSFFA
ncbi:DUF397 domain-containing protein [Streptomyces sp. P38-E01]|uniref:DUF397 domain-containing protein n=1 Tax=Streptomyces tardus TaxID=2780544 RepID=A0A949N541_9ACTN|nr:DUF397 domain-containing protein [Streptomyces tardus]MBU7598564.1 DUF397 domain-containing protein [Streptomyces tardus]